MQKSIIIVFFIAVLSSGMLLPLSYAYSQNTTLTASLKCINSNNKVIYDNVTINISNASVTYPYPRIDTNRSFGFLIHNSTNGEISIHVPPDLQRSYNNDMVVLLNGQLLPSYRDNITASNGIITRNIPDGTTEFEFAMTGPAADDLSKCLVVPEFGPFSIMIITISFVAVIFIQRKLQY